MSTENRYVSRYPNLRLTVHGGGSQPMINQRTGIQELHVVDPVFIQFQNHEFCTSDPDEIEFIEKCPDFTGEKGHRIIIEKAAAADPEFIRTQKLIKEHGAARMNKALELLEKAEAKKKAAKGK